MHGFVFLGGVLDEIGHVDGFAVIDHCGAAIAEIITIFDSGRDDVNRCAFAKLAVGIEGNVEDAFAHAKQRVLGAMGALWENVELHAVANYINGLVHRFVVVAHGIHAIAL